MDDWKNTEESPKSKLKGIKVRVGFPDGSEKDAYYYHDGMAWAHFYTGHTCHYWDTRTHQPLSNVDKWKYLNKDLEV